MSGDRAYEFGVLEAGGWTWVYAADPDTGDVRFHPAPGVPALRDDGAPVGIPLEGEGAPPGAIVETPPGVTLPDINALLSATRRELCEALNLHPGTVWTTLIRMAGAVRRQLIEVDEALGHEDLTPDHSTRMEHIAALKADAAQWRALHVPDPDDPTTELQELRAEVERLREEARNQTTATAEGRGYQEAVNVVARAVNLNPGATMKTLVERVADRQRLREGLLRILGQGPALAEDLLRLVEEMRGPWILTRNPGMVVGLRKQASKAGFPLRVVGEGGGEESGWFIAENDEGWRGEVPKGSIGRGYLYFDPLNPWPAEGPTDG